MGFVLPFSIAWYERQPAARSLVTALPGLGVAGLAISALGLMLTYWCLTFHGNDLFYDMNSEPAELTHPGRITSKTSFGEV